MRSVSLGLLVLAASSAGITLPVLAAQPDGPPPQIESVLPNAQGGHQNQAGSRGSRGDEDMRPPGDTDYGLDGKIAGMRAALALSSDQEKLWTPFEDALRASDNDRLVPPKSGVEGGQRPSPLDRIAEQSNNLAKRAADMRKIADTGKALVAGLTDAQKRYFDPLMADMMPAGRGPGDGMRPPRMGGEFQPGRFQRGDMQDGQGMHRGDLRAGDEYRGFGRESSRHMRTGNGRMDNQRDGEQN